MSDHIVIAGANGFIGRALIAALGQDRPIIALSRSPKQSLQGHENIDWRACNLLSLSDTRQALEGAKTAVYLVHAMMPQDGLTEGDFEDIDLVCADNFAQAAKSQGIQHIIYLSGLMPDARKLSRHLSSRLEVEQTFKTSGVNLTTLRAGMVIGPGGSSFQLMARLVDRLPVIIAPKWTQSKSQAVALDDVVRLIGYAINHPKKSSGTWDIGCPEVLTYREMMVQTAEALGKKATVIDVPFDVPALSLWGVSLIANTPRQLVVPLVESLQHTLVAKDDLALQARAGIKPTPFAEALSRAILQDPPRSTAKKRRKRGKKKAEPSLCLRRIPMSSATAKHWNAGERARWLPKILNRLVKAVDEGEGVFRFYGPKKRVCLLELTFSPEQSSASQQVFLVSGGALGESSQTTPARFEFRTVLEDKSLLLLMHNFMPRLRWLPQKAAHVGRHTLMTKIFKKSGA